MKMNTMNKKFTSLILLQISFFIFWSFFPIGNANENKQEHWLILENTSEQSINDLPELPTESINKQDNNQKFIAEKGSKLGTILSSENSTNTARNMLENTLMQKINRDINNWFNQVAYARIQFNTDKSGNAAILYPLYDKDSHIVFTQLGLQINEDRTTTNMGFGYRQLNNDWMWGVNSFYDSTSSNRRLGLGAEASADFIKLSSNGYFRLSDWHGSKLDNWRDFDERPANGFDVRFEGFLPDYPQFGANLKYEHYYGKNVNINNGSYLRDLKNNPSLYSVGVSYTPIPLVTMKLNQSVGSSSDTSAMLQINYRFDLPLNRQLSADSVKSMRSLTGLRYDFVDRNYDIVMQYKKQELLTISLPNELEVQSKQQINLTATIIKSKYGVKDIQWSAPELIADGGSFIKTSVNSIKIVLPPIQNNPKTYTVTAIAIDNNGNKSNTATTRLNVKPMSGMISIFTVVPQGSVTANDSDNYEATVTVTDAAGKALSNTNVEFTLSGFSPLSAFTLSGNNISSASPLTLPTDSNGQIIINIWGQKAQQGLLIAKLEDGYQSSKPLQFIADSSTAQIISSDIVVIEDNAVANNKATNRISVHITDKFGNSIENQLISVSANNGATVGNITPTDANGDTIFSLTSFNAGNSEITITFNGSHHTVNVMFMPDKSTAQIDSANMILVKDNATANGVDTNKIKVIVTDAHNNPLPNQVITVTAENGAIISAISPTNSQGETEFTLTSLKAAQYRVTAEINGSTQSLNVTFVGDNNSAKIDKNDMVITKNNAKANGVDTDRVKVIVTDKNGNPLADQIITVSTDTGVIVGTVSPTNTAGETEFSITSTEAKQYKITAELNGSSQSVSVDFIADTSTAQLDKSAITVVKNDAKADKIEINQIKVKIIDANNNPIKGQRVTVTADPHIGIGPIPETDINGETIISLTSSLQGPSVIALSINNSTQDVTVTFTSAIDPSKSTLTLDKTRIVNSSGATEDGRATITLTMLDKNNQPITGVKNDVKFTANNNELKISNVTETLPGQYTAVVTSSTVGDYQITATVLYSTYTAQSPTISVYTYIFRLSNLDHKIGVTALYDYQLFVKSSDGVESEIQLNANQVNWISSNTSVARPISPGEIQGLQKGIVDISVSSTGTGYKGVPVTVIPAKLTVSELNMSPIYGDSTSKPNSASEYLIEPPGYTLTGQGDWVVDSIGNSGGTGGTATTITNTDSVTKIDVIVCRFQGVLVIGQLTFYKPTSNQVIGEAHNTCTNPQTYVYQIPSGEQFIGFTGWNSQTSSINRVFLGAIRFITIDR